MNKNLLALLTVIIFLITIIGLQLDVMTPDAALYATISKLIYYNNDFIHLYSLGTDWLDKPHLPFWLSALSFKIFGVSNFAYKLPGVFSFFLGAFFTYKFAKELYNKEIAIIALLILITSFHSVLSNFDVRAEPFLTGFIIASVYWFYKYVKTRRYKYIILGSLFASLAIMTKGIFSLIPIICALGGEFIIKRQWKTLLNPVWLISLVVILVFITPELYALYHQFDLHPEKLIFGKNNVSGIRFFFWDSQIGRFFNQADIKITRSRDITFFLHTILWAFLPWAILFYMAIFLKVKRNFKKLLKEEFYTLFAVLGTLIVFSLSKFQLAHYTNIIFPFMAIITADFIYKLQNEYAKLFKSYSIIQTILLIIGLALIPILFFLVSPQFNWMLLIIIGFITVAFYQLKKSSISKVYRIFFISIFSYCLIYGFIMTHFYPTILQYQGGVASARYANDNLNESISFVDNSVHNFGFEFYLDDLVKRVPGSEIKNQKGKLFFCSDIELTFLKENNILYDIEKEFKNYKVTKIKGAFLNYKTRNSTLNNRYIIRLK